MSRDKCKSPALGHVWSPEQLRVVGLPGYFPALQKGVWSCSRSCKQVYNCTGMFCPALLSIARASAGALYPVLGNVLQKAWKQVQNNPKDTNKND